MLFYVALPTVCIVCHTRLFVINCCLCAPKNYYIRRKRSKVISKNERWPLFWPTRYTFTSILWTGAPRSETFTFLGTMLCYLFIDRKCACCWRRCQITDSSSTAKSNFQCNKWAVCSFIVKFLRHGNDGIYVCYFSLVNLFMCVPMCFIFLLPFLWWNTIYIYSLLQHRITILTQLLCITLSSSIKRLKGQWSNRGNMRGTTFHFHFRWGNADPPSLPDRCEWTWGNVA